MNELSVNEFGGLDVRDDMVAWNEKNSALCCNIEIDDGKLKSRGGHTKHNTSSLNKDNVLSIFDYDGENNEVHKVYAVSDGTSCSLQSGDSGMAIIKTGDYPFAPYDAAIMNAQLFLVNGINKMSQIVNNDEITAGIGAPTSAPTFNSNIDGNLSQSVSYYFVYTYYNSKLGKESNRSPVSAVMTTGGTSATDGIRINIPANASLDSQIDTVRVYRTYENETDLYFYDQDASYSGTAITVDSVQADAALGSTQAPYAGASTDQASDYSIPPICACAEEFGGSVWQAGTYVHDTGNVNVTNGSATVSTGAVSPQFHVDMAGATFFVIGDTKEYTISTVASATSLTLSENYAGTTGSNKSYTIYRDGSVLYNSLFENNASKPWAYPTANRIYVPEIPNVLALKKTSTYLLIMGRNDIQKIVGTYGAFQRMELKDGVGVTGKMAVATDGSGNVIFYSGVDIYITDGTSVIPLDSEGKLKKYLEYCVNHERDLLAHMQYLPSKGRIYLWLSELGSSTTNKLIEYDISLGSWILADIPATCSGIITNEDTGEDEVWFGDSFGFVHRLDVGKNYGAGTSGTRYGTATGATSTTLTDSTATFNTTGDGLKGVRVYIALGTGAGQYGTIQSNTSTELTVDSWSGGVTPNTTSVYAIGAINAYYYTKVYDFDDPVAKKRLVRIATNNTIDSNSPLFSVKTIKDTHSVGTLAVTNGSSTVTGTGTSFASTDVGAPIRINNEHIEYVITSVSSATSIKISSAYAGETASGLRYRMPFHSQTLDMSSNDFCQSFPRRQSRYFQMRFGNLATDQDFTLYGYTLKSEPMDWNRSV